MVVKVSGIYCYPIKSCAGTMMPLAEIGKRGILHDREWALIDMSNKCLTQRDVRQMCLIHPVVNEADGVVTLSLSAEGMPTIDVPVTTAFGRKETSVWSNRCVCDDQGDEAASWLSRFLGVQVRLVKMASDYTRQVDQDFALRETDEVGFADEFPLLLISEESLQDLNKRLPEAISMNRFRPNIVVSGCEPFAEDGWKIVRIGDVTFDFVKPCARCVVTTIEQSTAVPGPEPLKTLSKYRQSENRLLFGQNIVHHGPGKIQLGDELEMLN